MKPSLVSNFCRVCLATMILSSVYQATAQDFSVCQSVITTGLRDYNINLASQESLDTIYENYCGSSQNAHSSDTNAGLSAVIKAIPVSLTFGSSDNTQAMSNFCRNYSSVHQAQTSSSQYSSKIVREAYKTFENCLQIVRSGASVNHNVVSTDKISISFKAAVGKPIEIDGIDTSTNVLCKGQNQTKTVVTYTLASRESSLTNLGIACTRSPTKQTNGNLVYERGRS